MENSNIDESRGKFWPYMILGFLAIGITLGYWTVKHAIGMPVHESNEYMMKYQNADLDANKIEEAQALFNQHYKIELDDMKLSNFKPEHLKRKAGKIVALSSVNRISYSVVDRSGNVVSDANVSLLLTRPHTEKEDQLFKKLPFEDGHYILDKLTLKNPGRYILRVRVQKGKAIGYMDTAGFLNPKH